MKIKGDNVLVINTKYDTWAHRKYSKLVKKKKKNYCYNYATHLYKVLLTDPVL